VRQAEKGRTAGVVLASGSEILPVSSPAPANAATPANAYVPVRGQVLSRVERQTGQEVMTWLGLLLILLAVTGGAVQQWERGRRR